MLRKIRQFIERLRMREVTVVDLDILRERQLKQVRKWGSDAGRRNEPPADAAGPDAHEKELWNRYRTLLGGVQDGYRRKLEREQARQDQAYAKLDPGRFDDCREELPQTFDNLKATTRDPLITAKNNVTRVLRDLRAFSNQRNITREAQYPESLSLYYAALFMMVLFEGAANSYFFAIGSTRGLVGGFIQAVLIAAVNVTISFYAGVALRGLHNAGPARPLAVAAGVVYVVVLILFQLAVGHFRAAMTNNPDRAEFEALANLIHSPLSLPDLQTWLLVLIGVLFAVAAAATGYKCDDPILGYGAVTRRFKAAQAAYQGLKDDYLLRIQEAGESQLAAVSALLDEATAAQHEIRASVVETKRLARSYQLVAAAIIALYKTLVLHYRATNQSTRTDPPPAWFSADPEPLEADESIELDPDAIPEPEQVLSDLRAHLTQLRKKGSDVKRQIREHYTDELRRTPDFFDMIDGKADRATATQQGHIAPQEVQDASSNGKTREDKRQGEAA